MANNLEAPFTAGETEWNKTPHPATLACLCRTSYRLYIARPGLLQIIPASVITGYSSKPFAQKLRFLRKLGRFGKPAGNGDGISEAPNPRFAARSILHDAAIPYCILGEDILSAYGVPTILFDLFLLASDPEKAAAKLIEMGYVRKELGARFNHTLQFSNSLGPATSSEGDRIPADKSRLAALLG